MAKLRKRQNLNYDEIDYGQVETDIPESTLREILNCSVEDLEVSKELLELQAYMPISDEDRETLKRDIEESGVIRDPIKTYRRGKKFAILGGYNRWDIARELGWETVPVEVVDLKTKERGNLVIDDNLSRRHLTNEQRIMLLARRYPGYFESAAKELTGRPKKGVTVTPFSSVEISKKTGLSESSIKKSKAAYQEAKKEAKKEGRNKPTLIDLKKAKEAKNAERRAKGKAPKKEKTPAASKNKEVKKESSELKALKAERDGYREDIKNVKVLVETDSNAITLLCKNDDHVLFVLTELEKHMPEIMKASKQAYVDNCQQNIKRLDDRIKALK